MEKESTSGEEKKWTHVSIEMNKWKYNRVNLYTNNPLSFPPAKIYSLQWTSIINQSLDNSPTAWLFYGRVLFWSFILPLGNIFFFQQIVKNFCCSRFLKFLVRTNFCNLLFKQQNINKEQNLTCLTFFTG